MSEGELPEKIETIKLCLELPTCLSPKKESVEIETTFEETLPQLKETLGLIPRTENLTNFNIYYQNINLLETFSEMNTFGEILDALNLKDVKTLNLKLVEKPYNLANVYEHLLKLRQVIGLHFLDKSNMDFGANSGVSKFDSLDLTDVKVHEEKETKSEAKEEDKKEEFSLTNEEKSAANEAADSLLKAFEIDLGAVGSFKNPYKDFKLPIKSLTISQWSPVPQFQKTKGDLLYLTLQTLENENYQITCHFSGFFVNKSSIATFNPQIKHNLKFNKHFILFDLIRNLSPLFEKTLIENSSNLHTLSKSPESYLIPTTSFTSYPWLLKEENLVNNPDLTQSQLPFLTGGVDGGDLVRDWNEEFQSIKELPKNTVNERILREKLINKTIHEFNKVATETAINIINGNLTSLNISEDPEELTYLRNGIFYSHGIDATGAFAATGGDDAARYTSGKDLNAVKLLNRVDSVEVHNLLTLVVDYMGKRVICQAPVPGIFQETRNIQTDEVFDKVVYGLNSENSQIVYNEKFNEALSTIADAFHLKPHTVELENGIKSDQKLTTSKDMKGIHGTDGRKYMIDLYRTTPLDISFIESHFEPNNERSYPHKETLIRHEALEEWWKRKIAALIKSETEKLEKEGKEFETKDGEKPQLVVQGDQVVVNTDAFTGINESSEDQSDVREISDFILTLINEFLDEISSQLAPFDGTHLATILHRSGINLRYLGYIANQALERKAQETKKIEAKIEENLKLAEELKKEEEAKKEQEKENPASEKKEEEKEEENKEEGKTNGSFEPSVANYETVFKLSVQEMIARAVKHVLRQYSKSLPLNLMSTFVSHFMNCLLGSAITENPVCLIDEDIKTFSTPQDLKFTTLTAKDVSEMVSREVFVRFRYELPADWLNTIVKPVQLFREISIKFGIQWKAQQYSFTKEEFEDNKERMVIHSQVIEPSKKNGKKGKKQQSPSPVVEKTITRSSIFIADDIVDFVPLIKDSSYKPTLLDEVLETARTELEKDKKNGLILYNELLSFHEQIFGRVHSETAAYYSYLSQLYSELNLPFEASTLARVACVLNERTNGFDSYNTITAYINSGFFDSSNEDFISSLKLYNHAISTWSSVYGDDHPSFVTTFANLAETLTNVKLYESSKKLFEKAIDMSKRINGEISEVTGLIMYRYGYTLIVSQDHKGAREQFAGANEIFQKVLGPKDHFTVKSLSFATNLKTYLDYQRHEKSKKLEQAKSKSKPVKSSAPSGSKKNNKKKNKNTLKINEEIATKSVDDIMAFIDGSKK